jgi:hypothetical protein
MASIIGSPAAPLAAMGSAPFVADVMRQLQCLRVVPEVAKAVANDWRNCKEYNDFRRLLNGTARLVSALLRLGRRDGSAEVDARERGTGRVHCLAG